ncbi:MAG: WD40/YVTN/BNR-like repeat-containing protein [Acidobacteriota bacterium]
MMLGRCSGWVSILCTALVLQAGFGRLVRAAADPDESGNPLFKGLEWREIGPYRGGRAAAVAGIPDRPQIYYFGSTGGGVWKTMDGGFNWRNVSDGFFGGSIGAVAVSEWDPNIVYVGTGESTVRGNVSHGDGIWKSTDAGRTWTHSGLEDSRHIPRIRIHPTNPDRVWAAVLGHLYGPSRQRGVFRSDDGGRTWTKVLHVNDSAGAIDLALDPTNPRILYAAFWRVRRTPYGLESGGEGSSLWKSIDGGDTWQELTDHEGLPAPPLGISGIAVSPGDPDNLYAIVEAREGGVFRSRDGGKTWKRTSGDRSLRQRAWYYSRIYADPASVEAVWVVNVRLHHSVDGGRTFKTVATPHGDNHDLWIDPHDPLRMIEANDGGVNATRDGGKIWTPQNNQPTAQIYRVSTDNSFPYRLLGGQQDNSALRIRSRSPDGAGITMRDWEPTAGGESGFVVARPDHPEIVYGGSYGGFLARLNHETGERRAVSVWPDNPMGWGAADLRYRFQWNFPLFFSPHNPSRLYAAANVLFRTEDGGENWRAISPDLTRADRSKMRPSGGPITKDNTSVEYYGTIFAAVESPLKAGILWTGSDDGRLHLSRDDGASWQDVTPPRMPEWMLINSIEAHPFEPGGLYVAGTRYKLDDFRPYLYRTLDFGRTWTLITDGIRKDHFTRVIRADSDRPGLLYAGTEQGVYVSFNDGRHWEPLQINLPITPITDLAVKNKDLVAATQGRGFWILDDLTPLHQLTPEVRKAQTFLFTPRETVRLPGRGNGGAARKPVHAGANPPAGVIFHYLLARAPSPKIKVKLQILAADGSLLRTFTRKPDPSKKPEEDAAKDGDKTADLAEDLRLLPAGAGMNRFVWNLRLAPAAKFKGMVLWNRFLNGPLVVPGAYRARLTVGDWIQEVEFTVGPDPRSSATMEDLAAQFRFLLDVRDKVGQTHETLAAIAKVKDQIKTLLPRVHRKDGKGNSGKREAVAEALKSLRKELEEIQETLYQTRMQSRQDPLNFPIRLNDKLAGLLRLGAMGDRRPTASLLAVRDELFAAIDAQIDRFTHARNRRFKEINRLAREAGMEFLSAP